MKMYDSVANRKYVTPPNKLPQLVNRLGEWQLRYLSIRSDCVQAERLPVYIVSRPSAFVCEARGLEIEKLAGRPVEI